MKAFKIMLFSVLLLALTACSAPQTSENPNPLIRSQTSSEPQERISVVWGVLLNTFDDLGHEMAAQRMAQTCRSMSPNVEQGRSMSCPDNQCRSMSLNVAQCR